MTIRIMTGNNTLALETTDVDLATSYAVNIISRVGEHLGENEVEIDSSTTDEDSVRFRIGEFIAMYVTGVPVATWLKLFEGALKTPASLN